MKVRFKRQNTQQKITAVTLASFDDPRNKRSRLVFLVIAFLLFWFVTYAYAYTYLLVPLKPLYSYILFIGLAAAIGLFSINTRLRLPLPYLEMLKPFYLWFSFFIIYYLFFYIRLFANMHQLYGHQQTYHSYGWVTTLDDTIVSLGRCFIVALNPLATLICSVGYGESYPIIVLLITAQTLLLMLRYFCY